MWLISLLIFLAIPKAIFAQVKINDFCATCNPEWVDIKNTGTTEVDLTGWYIRDNNSSLTDDIVLLGFININEIIKFNHSSGWLNNDTDIISLKDNLNNIIDLLSYPVPTATSSPTPVSTNTPIPTQAPPPTGGITPTDILPTNTPTPLPIPISNLYINEIMPNPETGSEWVEIFNDNDFDIDLEDYKLKDDTTHYRIISANSILAHSYYIFMFSNYLNNDKDSVTLFDLYNRQIGETVLYIKTTKGYSYSLQADNTWCLTTNSLNQDNNSCYQEPTNPPTGGPKPTDTPKPTHPPTGGPKNTPTPKPPKTPKSPKATSTPKLSNPPTGGPTSGKSKQKISQSTGFIPPQISLSPTAKVTLTTPLEEPKSNLISVLFLSFGGIFLLAPLFIV